MQNDRFRLQLSPDLGARWLSCDVKHNRAWTPLLWKAPSFKAALNNPFLYGMYFLAPWCNRVRDGRFRWEKKTHALRRNLADRSAMHGDVYARKWTVLAKSATMISLALDSRQWPNFNFPGRLVFGLTVTLNAQLLRVQLTARNADNRAWPVGLGFHPFFVRPTRFMLPAGAQRTPGGPYPTRTKKVRAPFRTTWQDPADTEFDDSFCALNDGAPARLDIGREHAPVEMRWSNNVSDVFVYAPRRHDGQRADFVCIEPMTMSPNALASRDRAMLRSLRLEPGKRRTISMSLRYAPARP